MNSNIGDEEDASYLRVYSGIRSTVAANLIRPASSLHAVFKIWKSEGVRQRIENCFNFKTIKIFSVWWHKGSNRLFTPFKVLCSK